MHIPKQKRKKLDEKSMKCILLGYSRESKVYRLMEPNTKKIYISRDVIFDEKNDVSSPTSSPIEDSAPIFNMDGKNDGNVDSQSPTINVTKPLPNWYTSTI